MLVSDLKILNCFYNRDLRRLVSLHEQGTLIISWLERQHRGARFGHRVLMKLQVSARLRLCTRHASIAKAVLFRYAHVAFEGQKATKTEITLVDLVTGQRHVKVVPVSGVSKYTFMGNALLYVENQSQRLSIHKIVI